MNTKADNDNDELTFTPISLAARRVMERLFAEFHNENARADDGDRSQKDKGDQHSGAKLKFGN